MRHIFSKQRKWEILPNLKIALTLSYRFFKILGPSAVHPHKSTKMSLKSLLFSFLQPNDFVQRTMAIILLALFGRTDCFSAKANAKQFGQ